MTRDRPTTAENRKHGTRTPEGQKRTRAARAAKAEAAGLVDEGASRREVDAAIKRSRIEFIEGGRKVWADVEHEFVHVADLELSISQMAIHPFPGLSCQVPLSYAGDMVQLAQFGGGPVFARLYRLRPQGVNSAVSEALDRLEALNREVNPGPDA